MAMAVMETKMTTTLRELCSRHGAVRALARDAGISHVLLLYLQRGQRRLSDAVAERLSKALGIPVSDVLESTDDDGHCLHQDGPGRVPSIGHGVSMGRSSERSQGGEK